MTVDPFIEAEEVAGHSVQNACRLLEVSKSAFYERRNGVPSRREVSDAELLEKISAIHTESKGTYGSPRVHKELLHRHVACGKRKVSRLMRAAGLEGRCKKRWRKTTVADPDAEAARDLIQRHFGPCEDMDRRYVGDITYIATWEGWAYLATVIDLASRRVVGWALADHMRTELVQDALTMAFEHRAPEQGVIFHSDRGCQYTSQDFCPAGPGQRCRAFGRAHGRMLGQRGGRKLFRHNQARAHRHAFMADTGRTSTRCLRVHRGLVQHPPAALDARLPQPRSIRSRPPQRRPSGGIISTSNLSVEPD
jgi:putative transposase